MEHINTSNALSVDLIERFRDELLIGETIKAHVFVTDSSAGHFITQEVTILKKYPHIALTDKGAVAYVDIAIKNKGRVRRMRDESMPLLRKYADY